MAKIFKKETNRPFTNYQKQINVEAGKLPLAALSLLGKRGRLLEEARIKVVEKGYAFVKGISRSKRLCTTDDTAAPTREKITADVRAKRIAALEEDIANIDQQLKFKEKRRLQAEGLHNYRVCEEEIGLIKQQRRKLSCELSVYREKERKAQ